VLNKSLTIVLPVYNGETRLRGSVNEILELASELTNKFGVLIIDDGSTDSTYEVAEELAAHYPQVSVRRHRHRRGLGDAINYAQRRVHTDAVIVHDGVTPIDTCQMRNVWHSWVAESASGETSSTASPTTQRAATCDFGNLTGLHTAMERAHNRVVGFQIVTPISIEDEALKPMPAVTSKPPRSGGPYMMAGTGVGQIPQLPRPKLLKALARFAFGE
jgi:hypothetical protein